MGQRRRGPDGDDQNQQRRGIYWPGIALVLAIIVLYSWGLWVYIGAHDDRALDPTAPAIGQVAPDPD